MLPFCVCVSNIYLRLEILRAKSRGRSNLFYILKQTGGYVAPRRLRTSWRCHWELLLVQFYGSLLNLMRWLCGQVRGRLHTLPFYCLDVLGIQDPLTLCSGAVLFWRKMETWNVNYIPEKYEFLDHLMNIKFSQLIWIIKVTRVIQLF